MKIETKVIAAAAGSGLGAALGTFILWLLAVLVWHADASASAADQALAAIPGPVSGLVVILVSIVGAAVAGYAAPHTQRTDLGDPATATVVHNVFPQAPVDSTPGASTPADPEAPSAGVPPAISAPAETAPADPIGDTASLG